MNKTKRIETFFEIFRIIAAILIAFLIALGVLVLISDEPLNAIYQFMIGPFTTLRRIGDIIAMAIPLTLTGVAMCFMYAVNKFNLVSEGIFVLSGCMASVVALLLKDANIPHFLFLAILLAVGMVCGAIAAAIPALLDAKFNANVVVVSLMLNYILLYLSQYILKYKIKDNTIAYTASHKLPQSALFMNIVPKTLIHGGVFVAIICVIVAAVLFFKTPFGYSMRVVGNNKNFAKYSGLSVMSTVIGAQIIGGMFAGIGGTVELLGRYDRFQWTTLTNHGFDGLMVAVLAHKNPALAPLSALLLAYIRVGAAIVTRSTDIPAEFVSIVQGIIVLLVAAEMFLSGVKNKVIFKSATDEMENKEKAKAV